MLARATASAKRRIIVGNAPTSLDVTTFSTKTGDGATAIDSTAKTLTIAYGTGATSLRGQHPVASGTRYRISWTMASTNATQGQAGFGTSLGGPQYRPTLGGVAGENAFEFTSVSTVFYPTFQRASTGETTFSNIVISEIPQVAWANLSPQPIVPTTWTALSSGVTVNGSTGAITIAATGTNLSAAGSVTTVVGKLYRLAFTVATNTVQCAIGTSQGSAVLKSAGVNHSIGFNTYEFSATSTTTWIQFQRSISGTTVVSEVALQEVASNSDFTFEFTSEYL